MSRNKREGHYAGCYFDKHVRGGHYGIVVKSWSAEIVMFYRVNK